LLEELESFRIGSGERVGGKMAEDKKQVMTADAGRPVGENQNSLTVGPRGPIIFEDYRLFEKMAHFNHDCIPERVLHAKGSGAHGHFVCTSKDITRYTTAKLFGSVGKKTPNPTLLQSRSCIGRGPKGLGLDISAIVAKRQATAAD
jgi:Catalase